MKFLQSHWTDGRTEKLALDWCTEACNCKAVIGVLLSFYVSEREVPTP